MATCSITPTPSSSAPECLACSSPTSWIRPASCTWYLNADHPGAVADWHLGVGTSLRLAIVDGLGDLVQYGRRQLDQGGWDFERQCHIREVHGHRAVGGVLLEPDEDSGCRGNADQAGEEQNKLHLESDSGLRLKSVGEGFGFYRQICWNKIVLRMCEPYGLKLRHLENRRLRLGLFKYSALLG